MESCNIPKIDIIIVMGASGAGNFMIGKRLARELGWTFYEGDNIHLVENIEKMRQDISLTEKDRQPWLSQLKQLIQELRIASQHVVISCLALRQTYRDYLTYGNPHMVFVYLTGSEAIFRKRLLARQNHFMKVDLLASQLSTVESPEQTLTLDFSASPQSLVKQIKRELRL